VSGSICTKDRKNRDCCLKESISRGQREGSGEAPLSKSLQKGGKGKATGRFPVISLRRGKTGGKKKVRKKNEKTRRKKKTRNDLREYLLFCIKRKAVK